MVLGRDAGGNAALFHFVMIKPTHYDDDGYPIQWFRSAIPSNTLACLNGLARGRPAPRGARRRTSRSACTPMTRPTGASGRTGSSAMIRKAGGKALIGLVGVQSNQFPRAVDLARPFLAAGLPVCIGGFHVSGCIAMLPEMPPEMREAQALGISFFAGEAEEGRLDEVLRDAWNGTLKPLYNYMNDLPSLQGEPPPILPRQHVRRTSGSLSSVDLGRGCPYQCSFCTIINVQGRKSRFRSRRRSRADRARELRAGHQALLHHRRQFRPQPRLGSDVRPPDRAARRRGPEDRLHHPGRHAVPQDPELHREGGAGRRAPRLHRAGEHQSRTICSPPRSARTRSPNTARCCRNGASTAPSPMPATSSVSRATPRNRSCATSRSSSASCRSTSWSSSS